MSVKSNRIFYISVYRINSTHQFGRGHDILWEDDLHMSRQLHGQRTYFFPGGAALIGCNQTAGKTHKTSQQHTYKEEGRDSGGRDVTGKGVGGGRDGSWREESKEEGR